MYRLNCWSGWVDSSLCHDGCHSGVAVCPAVLYNDLAACPSPGGLCAAHTCRNLHVPGKAQRPLFQDEQMHSRVSGLETRLPAAGGDAEWDGAGWRLCHCWNCGMRVRIGPQRDRALCRACTAFFSRAEGHDCGCMQTSI